MSTVTDEYLDHLPKIYQDILDVFWMFNPNHRPHRGLAADSAYAMVRDKYTLGEVVEAFEQMADGGALRKEKEAIYLPTPVGEEMIRRRHQKSGRSEVPAFVPPE
jgi:hypothetical protein